MSTLETIRQQAEIWKAFQDIPDDAVVDSKLAAVFLGISHQSLARMRGKGGSPPYVQLREDDSTARNQRVNYILKDLRAWRESNKVSSTMEAAQLRGLTFSTLPSLLEEQPFWILTTHSKSKGTMGRGEVSESLEVIADHVFTIPGDKFSKLLQDPNAEVQWISLDEAMSRPWANDEARQPFHEAYTKVLQQSIDRSAAQQEAAILRALNL